MKIIDISWPISPSMTQYKDKKRVTFESIGNHEPYVMEHMINVHSHTGTHIDAPAHFVKGANMIDQFALERYLGPCYVADMSHVQGAIKAEDIQAINTGTIDKVLLKTSNSLLDVTESFDYHFVSVDQSAAQVIINKGWRLIGIDYLGIESNQPNHETHILLGLADIIILEGLRLHDVQQGYYELILLPLALQNIEAAPARAILIKK